MHTKFKILLIISNVFLLIFGLNLFAKFIVGLTTKMNVIIILFFCLANVVIALKASFEAAEDKS